MGIRQIFIQNLKYYRKQANLSQEKLAELIGMSTTYIGSMEACKRFPTPETIDKIASALNIKSSALFDESGSPESIKSTFKTEYSVTLKDEISKRVLKAIDEACDLI